MHQGKVQGSSNLKWRSSTYRLPVSSEVAVSNFKLFCSHGNLSGSGLSILVAMVSMVSALTAVLLWPFLVSASSVEHSRNTSANPKPSLFFRKDKDNRSKSATIKWALKEWVGVFQQLQHTLLTGLQINISCWKDICQVYQDTILIGHNRNWLDMTPLAWWQLEH